MSRLFRIPTSDSHDFTYNLEEPVVLQAGNCQWTSIAVPAHRQDSINDAGETFPALVAPVQIREGTDSKDKETGKKEHGIDDKEPGVRGLKLQQKRRGDNNSNNRQEHTMSQQYKTQTTPRYRANYSPT